MTETTTFTSGDTNTACHTLDMTLSGTDVIPDGIDTDGYRASYVYTLNDGGIPANDVHMSCFGLDADALGYFCVGVMSHAFTANEYKQHGSGYWMLNAEQLADKAARLGTADAAATSETAVEEEEVETFDISTCTPDDYYDYESPCFELNLAEPEDVMAQLAEWHAEGNKFTAENVGAEYTPHQECAELEDLETFELSTSHCAIVEPFTGSWYQPPPPAEGAITAGNYRFTAEDTGVGMCLTFGMGKFTDVFALGQINGAAALTAGAAIVAAAMY